MKVIKVCYSIRNNVGNALNPLIIEHISKRKIVWADQFKCETSAIGSGLGRFFVPRKYAYQSISGLKALLKGKIYSNPCQIWSAGFLTTPTEDRIPVKKQLQIASVRGSLSKQAVEKIYNTKLDITTGDAALLASELITKTTNKKYLLGIIPHFREKNEPQYQMLKDKIPHSIIIDVQADPIEVLTTISQCECIISSSLHGLVIADSFSVPNKQVVLTNKLIGDGFKFRDYYSSFDLQEEAININNLDDIDIEYIKGTYKITSDMVDKKKVEIVEAFNKYIL